MHKLKTVVPAGYLYAFLASATFGTYALMNRYVYITYHVGVFKYTITFLASGALFAGISLLASQLGRNKVCITHSLKNPIINGILAGTALAIFVYGQGYTTATNASILATSTIIMTALFSGWLLNEKLNRAQLKWFLAMFVGFYIAIVGTHRLHLNKGDLIVISSSLILGFTNVFSKIIMKNYPAKFVADIRLFVGGVFFLLIGLGLYGRDAIVTQAGFWPLLAGFFFWLTIRAFFAGIHYINPTRTLIIANTHPIFTPIIGALLLSEAYTWNKLVGAIILVVSIYFINTKRTTSNIKKAS